MSASQTIDRPIYLPGFGAFVLRRILRAIRSLAAGLLDGDQRAALEQTDEELMAAYIKGDQNAFRSLFDRYAPKLLRGARRRGLSTADAYDAVQQTFVHVHQSRRDFHPDAQVRPWIYTIAFNVMRDMGRRLTSQRKLRERVASEAATAERTSSSPVSESEEGFETKDALSKLTATQREVILLHYYQDMSFSEIARVLGTPEGAVRVRAHRGYEKLRRILESARVARGVS